MIRALLAPIVALTFVVALPAANADSSAKLQKKLVGSWQMVSMTKDGKTEKLPQGMSVIVTFERGGKYSLAMSMGGQSRNQAGKYWFKKGMLHLKSQRTGKDKIEKVSLRFAKKGTVMYMSKDKEVVKAIRVRAKAKK